MKVHTIGKYYLEFYETTGSMGQHHKSLTHTLPVYEGAAKAIETELAKEIAEVHPKIFDYMEYAMMPLYKGYTGGFRGGTENPKLAIASKCKLPFVRIFKLT